jgi:hypothetical protein
MASWRVTEQRVAGAIGPPAMGSIVTTSAKALSDAGDLRRGRVPRVGVLGPVDFTHTHPCPFPSIINKVREEFDGGTGLAREYGA